MLKTIRKTLSETFLYNIVWYFKIKKREKEEEKILKEWERNGKPVPLPHFLKQIVVKEYAKKFVIHIFVETGTYHGRMVWATKNTFRKIFSIELSQNLFKQAKKMFLRFKHISIIQGDSGKVLPNILADIKSPCLFWLDAHYSAGITARGEIETPIMLELRYILNHPIAGHVILIDDARIFGARKDYPDLETIKKLVLERHPNWIVRVEDDIIRIHQEIR